LRSLQGMGPSSRRGFHVYNYNYTPVLWHGLGMCGWVDGSRVEGRGWGQWSLSACACTVRLPSRSCVVQTTRAGLRTFSFAAAEAGRAKTRAAGYRLQTTDSRLQHSMNNEMRGGEKSRGERDEGLKTDTRTIDTKPFWTLATLVRSNCDAGGGF
jgi:hypothetical protein